MYVFEAKSYGARLASSSFFPQNVLEGPNGTPQYLTVWLMQTVLFVQVS